MKKTVLAFSLATLFATPLVQAEPQQVVTVPVASPAPTVAEAAVEPAAPAVVTVEVVKDTNTPAKKVEEPQRCGTSDACIEAMYHAFMQKNGWQESGVDAKGKSFYFGSAPVDVNRTNADYGKALALAYTEAYMNAVNKFSRLMVLESANETLQRAFSDSSTDARDFDKLTDGQGRTDFEALWAKVSKYAQAKLDQGLKTMGVDPSEFDAMPPDQKKKLFESALISKTMERTHMALGGVNVVGNFVHESDAGSQVGVVIAYSPAIEGIAQSLRQGKKPAIEAVGQPLSEQIPTDAKLLADMYGPRLLVDEKGPVIVSFAMWSPAQGPQSLQARYRDMARKQAQAEASAQIARFLTLSFAGNTETQQGKKTELNAVLSGKDGSITDRMNQTLIDMVDERNVAKTQARLTGLRTVREWQTKLDSGAELVGVVLAYSFSDIEYAKTIQEGPKPAAPKATPQQPVDLGTSSRESTVKSAVDVF